jgi:hypothetical protein
MESFHIAWEILEMISLAESHTHTHTHILQQESRLVVRVSSSMRASTILMHAACIDNAYETLSVHLNCQTMSVKTERKRLRMQLERVPRLIRGSTVHCHLSLAIRSCPARYFSSDPLLLK